MKNPLLTPGNGMEIADRIKILLGVILLLQVWNPIVNRNSFGQARLFCFSFTFGTTIKSKKHPANLAANTAFLPSLRRK